MQKIVIALVVTLLAALPILAQDEIQNTLPKGCNADTLSLILTGGGSSLAEANLNTEEVMAVITLLEESLAAMREACTDEASAASEDAIDYSAIPQARTEDGGFILGEASAPITIVEFADYVCPHCQTYHATMQEIIRTYVATGQAKFEYRFFPVVDPNLSPLTANMVECAEILNPGTFWQAHDLMYDIASGRFNSLSPFTFATRTGLDYDDMVTCVQEEAGQVLIDTELGQNANVAATPTIMVRYGDGELEFATLDGESLDRLGIIEFSILAQVIEAAQPGSDE